MYAQWRYNSPPVLPYYTITFDSQGGDPVEAVTAAAGTPVNLPAEPQKAGSSFNGWYSAAGVLYAWPHSLTASVTMYAQWKPVHTVTFDAAGGGPAPAEQKVAEGGTVKKPAAAGMAPPPGLYTNPAVVEHWYVADEHTPYNFTAPVTGSFTLHAKWTAPTDISGQGGANTLDNALKYIGNQTLGAPTDYTIMLDGDCSMASAFSANIKTANAVITLMAKEPVTISPTTDGSLFNISDGKLVLGSNITLQGRNSNTYGSLVYLNGSSASLTMKAGAAISGNPINNGSGGGVYIYQGSFTMEGGKISGNSAKDGGGVKVGPNGSFTMSGGTISGNSAGSSATNGGGGVYVANGGSFSKSEGVIYGHSDGALTDNAAGADTYGHAVYYYVNGSTQYYRDDTLEENDPIDTDGPLPANPGAGEVNGWRMRI
jgi:uncharacterized repeat protein (TIGR02543 family)